MTALSDLLNEAKGDLSPDDLIHKAEKRLGRTIPRTFRSTIYKALSGEHAANPREETLRQFADVFQLDIRRLRRAADKPAGELGPWVPVSEANRLDRDQRRALDALIKTIVRGQANERPTSDAGQSAGPRRLTPVEQEVADALQAARREASRGRAEKKKMDKTGEESQDPGDSEPA